jgi:peptidoglycan/LPS O-acetylase OafA/YrhL
MVGLAQKYQGMKFNGFFKRSLIFFGKISYGLYMYHLPLIRLISFLLAFISLPHILKDISLPVLGLLLTLIVASLSYYLIEAPFLRLKEHFAKVQSRPV